MLRPVFSFFNGCEGLGEVWADACAAVRTLLFCGLIGILVSLTLWHGKFLCFYIFSCSSNFIFPLLLSSSLNIQISHFFAPLTDFLYPDEGFIVLKK